jgi:hypothetical protein
MGSITAGTIVLDSSGYIRGGQTAYATGTGFWLGYTGGAYKFSIGSSTNYVRWSGSGLSIRGTLNATDLTAGTLDVARLSSGSIAAVKLGLGTWKGTSDIPAIYVHGMSFAAGATGVWRDIVTFTTRAYQNKIRFRLLTGSSGATGGDLYIRISGSGNGTMLTSNLQHETYYEGTLACSASTTYTCDFRVIGNVVNYDDVTVYEQEVASNTAI